MPAHATSTREQRASARISWVALVAVALAGSVAVAFNGFRPTTIGDYPKLFAHPMDALLAGHGHAFLTTLPPDGAGGSVLLRAPFALVAKLVAGDQLAIYRFGAAACLIAGGLVGCWLARIAADHGRAWYDQLAVVAIAVVAPAVLRTVFYGHPEEVLGASLCIAAVLCAARGRPGLAGAALGAAIVNKPWGLLAAPSVLLALPRGHGRAIAVAAGIAAAWGLAIAITSPQGLARTVSGAGGAAVANPDELWWPLARLGTRTISSPLWLQLAGRGSTSRMFVPSLIGSWAHLATLVLAGAAAIPLLRVRGRGAPASAAACMALLALVFLLRCLLDPADFIYYQLPFVLALAAWEALSERTPVLSAGAIAALWLVFNRTYSTSNEYYSYLAITLPTLAVLCVPASGRRLSSRAAFGPIYRGWGRLTSF
jgi:hypothetical protein